MHDSDIRQSYWKLMHGADTWGFDKDNDRDYDEYAEAGADEIFGKGI